MVDRCTIEMSFTAQCACLLESVRSENISAPLFTGTRGRREKRALKTRVFFRWRALWLVEISRAGILQCSVCLFTSVRACSKRLQSWTSNLLNTYHLCVFQSLYKGWSPYILVCQFKSAWRLCNIAVTNLYELLCKYSTNYWSRTGAFSNRHAG